MNFGHIPVVVKFCPRYFTAVIPYPPRMVSVSEGRVAEGLLGDALLCVMLRFYYCFFSRLYYSTQIAFVMLSVGVSTAPRFSFLQRTNGPGTVEPRMGASPAAMVGARAPPEPTGGNPVGVNHNSANDDGAHPSASQGEKAHYTPSWCDLVSGL